ncbi:MAG: hypothetical protein M3539_10390 [Acidobacteriota bacterium]|nr:hypothetical protein [Acidobacteriota bacterium]
MSKAITGDHLWAEMTDGQKIDAVLTGHATITQMSAGLLDGSEELRRVCRDALSHTDPSFANRPAQPARDTSVAQPADQAQQARPLRDKKSKKHTPAAALKQRFGLPSGFEPRWQRFGRSVLLEMNVYRLPDAQEFIPSRPVGTLGARQHLYALLTNEQYLSGRRGSVYVRLDGRIFDYSVDSANPSGDIFDTGYTIYDLERTGRYAPLPSKRKKRQVAKHARAAASAAGSKG